VKRLATLTIVVLLTLFFLLILWQLRSVVFMFLLALIIAATLDRPITALQRRGWSRTLAAAVVYLAGFGGLLLLIVAISIPLINELDPLVQDMLILYSNFQSQLVDLSGQRPVYIPRLPTTEQMAAWLASTEGEALMVNAMSVTQYVGGLLGQFALAVVLALYWTADKARFERLWLSLLAPERRVQARNFWRSLEADVGAYVGSELAQSLLAGLLLVIGYWAIGVEYPFFAASVAVLAWFIPLIGGAIAVGAAILVGALATPGVAAGAALITIAVLFVMELWLERRLFTHGRYWGVLVMLVMLALGDALGVVGLLVAPPVALALQIALNSWFESNPSTSHEDAVVDLPQMRVRLAQLRTRIEEAGEASEPRLKSLADKLERLLDDVEQATPGQRD
jgi:putative permease